jgi:hypothetical protein
LVYSKWTPLLATFLGLNFMFIDSGGENNASYPCVFTSSVFLYSLTPTYTVALLIYWKLMPYIGDGPLWANVSDNTNCDDYWWTNLLYINNFYPKYNDMVS